MANLFMNRQEHRLRALWRILIVLALFFAISFLFQLIIGIGVGIAAVASGLSPADTATLQRTPSISLILPLLTSLSSLAAIWLVYWIAARRIDHRPVRGYGFHFSGVWWRDFVFGLALGAFLMLFIFLVERAAGWITVTGTFWSSFPGLFLPTMITLAIMYISVGFYEEMLFRGYGLLNLAEGLHSSRIAPKVALLLAWLFSSMIFGLAHALNPNSTWISTLDLVMAGLFLAFGFILTGDLAIPIGIHITWNFFEGPVFGFPVSGGLNGAYFFKIQQSGPVVMTGGAFGPEAGLIGLAAITLGLALIWLWVRWTRHGAGLQGDIAVYNPPSSPALEAAAAGDPRDLI